MESLNSYNPYTNGALHSLALQPDKLIPLPHSLFYAKAKHPSSPQARLCISGSPPTGYFELSLAHSNPWLQTTLQEPEFSKEAWV